jgi:RNA polymerase sigma factor (sigma-70 family)
MEIRRLAEPRALLWGGGEADAARAGEPGDSPWPNQAWRFGDSRLVIEEMAIAEERNIDLIALDHALSNLAKFDDRKSHLVELRFFGGLTAEETANMLGMSLRSVNREWSLARAWLLREVQSAE